MSEEQNELLLRHLNGQLGPDEEAKVADLLRSNAEARTFLRAVAEQAVVVADDKRRTQSEPLPADAPPGTAPRRTPLVLAPRT